MAPASLVLLAAGGGLIGFLLSVLGAGGSILLLPLLVIGAGLPPHEAVPLSLLVVILLALVNLVPYLRRGRFAPRPALKLGLPALAGSWIGGSWVKGGLVSGPVQLMVFATAAGVASWLFIRRPRERTSMGGLDQRPTGFAPSSVPPFLSLLLGGQRLLLALPVQGVMVGLLTGIAGVGGGFAIVPALVLLTGLPMDRASGTSLLLIAFNGLVALGALGHWPITGLPLLLPLLLGGGVGATLGQGLAPRLSDRRLRQGFAALLIGSAMLTGAEAFHRQSLAGPAPGLSPPSRAHRLPPAGPS
jgi:hypothetical protein